MSEILCSTGALLGRPNGRNYRLLESFARQLNCDGFEFMMYDTWYDEIDELLSTVLAMNLYTPVMHCEKTISEKISAGGVAELQEAYRLFEVNCQIARKLDAKKLVFHLWNGRISDVHFENNFNAYPVLAQIAGQYGVDLLVENVVCNHSDPMTHWCQLKEKYPNIHFVFDTKMAAFHRQLDLLYQPEYDWLWKDANIRHYHVNDYAGGYMDWQSLRTLPIGKGHVDFERFFVHVNKTGYQDTFTMEGTGFNSEGMVDIAVLNKQFEYVRVQLYERTSS